MNNRRRWQGKHPRKETNNPAKPNQADDLLPEKNPDGAPDSSVTAAAEVGTSDFAEVPAEVDEEHSSHDELQRNLLDRLLYKGVLPRYAFPTDVATFHVFDPANSRAAFPAFRFTPSQSLPIALSTYAPGKDVWIANKRYRSGAIYSPIKGERARAWSEKALYYECRNCHFAHKRALSEGNRGERISCPACGTPDAFGEARYWIRPPGFAHPISWDEEVSPDDQPARSYATRAKLDAPTPPPGAEWSVVNGRLRLHYLREMLLVTNSGPRREGYTYCTLCGRIEPTAVSLGELSGPHKKPFPDDRHPDCGGGRAAKGVCLGVDFITDVLLLSLRVESPVRLTPGYFATEIALRTVSEAISKATCDVLQLEAGEVQADFRAALTEEGLSGLEAEVYVYDTLAGGAGFARQAGERIGEVLKTALTILSACDCDTSCYKCLRSFKNKIEHDRLDRHIGADLLRYILNDIRPELPSTRTTAAILQVAEDIARQAGPRLRVERDAIISSDIGPVTAPILITTPSGVRRVLCVTHPLTALTPSDDALITLQEYTTVVVDPIHELRVRRSLPWVTHGVLSAMGLDDGS